MKLAHSDSADKPENLVDMALQLQQFTQQASANGNSLYDTEKRILEMVLRMGHLATDRFLQLQGDGDLGPMVQTEDGVELQRSEFPAKRPLRTVFGEHEFRAFVYASGPKQQIALRPIDTRLSLPAGKASYLLEEFSQYFCVEQAFRPSANALHRAGAEAAGRYAGTDQPTRGPTGGSLS